MHDNDRDTRRRNVLLERQVAINGHQRGKARGAHRGQEFAVAETVPTLLTGGGYRHTR